MNDFDLRKYLAENRLLKEEIMVDTTVMVDPNNTLMSKASDEEIDYIKANITNVPKMSVEDFQERYDEYFNRFYGEGDPLDLQIKALQIHIDKGVLTREEAIKALAMLQGQDVEEFEDMFLAENKLLKENKIAQAIRDEAEQEDSKVGAAIFKRYAKKIESASKEDYRKILTSMERELIDTHPDTFDGDDDIVASFMALEG
jgi:hypothetical protein